MIRLRRGLIALALFGLPVAAVAQGIPVYQSGTITQTGAASNQPAALNRDGGLVPSGGLAGLASSGRGLSPFGVTDGADAGGVHTPGLGTCWNSAPTSGNYNQLCAGHDASGNGLFTLDSYGVATASLLFRINGATYGFPGNGQGNILGPNASVSGHLALFNNTGGTLTRDGGQSILLLNGDATGATDNATTFQTQVNAADTAGGGALTLGAGNWKLGSTVTPSIKTGILTMPGAYFSGAGSIQGNVNTSQTSYAGQTMWGFFAEPAYGGTATPSSANQNVLNVSGYIPVTGAAAGYQKNVGFFQAYSVDPSVYAAPIAGQYSCTICRESVTLEVRSQAAVSNGRIFSGHFLATTPNGVSALGSALNIEVENLTGTPQPFANAPNTTYALSIDNVGNTLTTSAIWIAPGSALFQDGIVFDYTSVSSSYLAIYSVPGSAQVARFALQKLGTSGVELTFTGGGGASDVWIAHADAADTALYFNSPSNHIFKIGGGEAINASASGLLVDAGLVVGSPIGSFKGGGTINAGTYYSQGTAGVTCAPGAPTASFQTAGGIVTHC